MKSRLAVLFGEVADRERRHPSEGVFGHLGASGKEAFGIRGARAKGCPGVPGPADFRAWSCRSRTRAKVLPSVPGPTDFRAWSRRSCTWVKVLPDVPEPIDFRALSRRGHWTGPRC